MSTNPLRDGLFHDRTGDACAVVIFGASGDLTRRLLAPALRHGRLVSMIGGLLVVAIGVAMLFDWLALLPQFVPFNSQI